MTSSPPPRTGGMLAILLMAPFMAQADVTITNVATPSIHADLGASGAALELVIGGYLVAYAVFLITGARLGQTHGYRRVFLVGVGVFTAASLLCGLAPSPVILVAGRVIQGFGAALMFPQALTGIQLRFHGPQRARAIGLYAAALSAGAVCGQILGGVLISADLGGSQWRSVFFVNVPIGAAVLLAARRLLPADQPERCRRLDLVGVGTLSASVLLLVVPLALGRSQGWPLWTWLCLAASVPALALFLSAQRRIAAGGGSPLVNLRALARPSVLWGLSSVAAATGTYYALLFTLALYVQQGLGDSPLVSGATLVAWVAAFGVAGQLVRRLPEHRRPLAAPAGCALLAGAYVAISASLLAGVRDLFLLVPFLAAGGLGLGAQFSAMISHLNTAVAPRYAPDISGVATTTMQIAGALAVALFGGVYLALTAHPGATSASHAFAVITAALAAVALSAAASAQRSVRELTARRRAL